MPKQLNVRVSKPYVVVEAGGRRFFLTPHEAIKLVEEIDKAVHDLTKTKLGLAK